MLVISNKISTKLLVFVVAVMITSGYFYIEKEMNIQKPWVYFMNLFFLDRPDSGTTNEMTFSLTDAVPEKVNVKSVKLLLYWSSGYENA